MHTNGAMAHTLRHLQSKQSHPKIYIYIYMYILNLDTKDNPHINTS